MVILEKIERHKIASNEIPRKFSAQLWIQGAVLFVVAIPSGIFWIFEGYFDVGILVFFALFIWLLINIWPDLGYRFAWDEDYLYMRDRGFAKWPYQRHVWTRMAIDDIAEIEEAFGDNPGGKALFMPFEVLKIYSRNSDDKMIWVHPASLNNYGVRIMLQHVYDRRPDLISDNVVNNFLNSDIKL